MSVDLNKGDKINLSKKDGQSLSEISVGLGWGKQVIKTGFFKKKITTKEIDLDASCVVYDDNGAPVDRIWYRKLRSKSGQIIHTGDDLVGGGNEDDPNEVINVNLKNLDSNIKTLIFAINSFSGESFKDIPSAFVNVTTDNVEVLRYSLSTSGKDYRGIIVAKITKTNNAWQFEAIEKLCPGRQQSIKDIEALAQELV